MRAWAFLLSFYLVFGQIYYAHSALPVAVATAKGVGTLVRSGVIMHGAGALARSSYKWCKANKVKCAGFLGGAYELILGDDDDDKKDDNLDKSCRVITVYNLNYRANNGHAHYATAYSQSDSGGKYYRTKSEVDNQVRKEFNQMISEYEPQYRSDYTLHLKVLKDKNKSQIISDKDFVSLFNSYCSELKVGQYVPFHTFYDAFYYVNHVGSDKWFFYGMLGAYKITDDDDTDYDRQSKEQELWDKLKDKLSDDDITNIVNNYGDDIDIDKYCASGATCYFLDVDFEKEINNNDYDIDKIDDKNCNTRNGKIYSCPDAKKKKDRDDDDDGQTNNNDDDDDKRDDGQTDKDKDGFSIPRIPNFVMPEFCTWAKWFCEGQVDKTDGEIKIDNPDLPANSVNINFGGGCPASHNFPFRLGGYTFTFTMSYTYICQIAQSMGFIVKVLSTIVAIYILLGIKS